MNAQAWLDAQTEAAPQGLRECMRAAVAREPDGSIQDVLARAALTSLRNSLSAKNEKASALHLLAADALLTHACAAAAEAGKDALAKFAAEWSPARFQSLLSSAP